jgi:hypothetical protein
MDGVPGWGWHKFKVGCKAFVVISLICYPMFFGLAEAVLHPIPSSLSIIYWLLLIPTFVVAIWGAFMFVDFYERRIVGVDVGYGGHLRRHHRAE